MSTQMTQLPTSMRALVKREATKGIWMEEVPVPTPGPNEVLIKLEKTAICVISEHGKIIKEAQVAGEPEALLHWIGDQDGEVAAIGLEVGPLSHWLHRRLSEAGQPVVLMEIRQVKGTLKAIPIKTDRRDAEEGLSRSRGNGALGWGLASISALSFV